MRVAYVTMAFPAPAEAFASSDVTALGRAGVAVDVHSLRPRHRRHDELVSQRGLDALALDHNSVRSSLRGVLYGVAHPLVTIRSVGWIASRTWRRPSHLVRSLALLPRAFDILARLRRDRPDVVHLFWGHYPALVGRLVLEHLPDTVLSVFLGAYDLEWRYGGSAPVARRADTVWTHAAHNLPALRELGIPEERVRVAYRGVDLRRFPDPRGPKVPGRIVTAGRLIPAKAMDDVLRAFRAVLDARPDASLVVLGEGPERAGLESLARSLGLGDSVRFPGHVSHQRVREEMAAAEIFILLSRMESERLPNVVKEAMASRCCCIVSRTAGIEELVDHGSTGLLATGSTAEEVATDAAGLALRALSDPAERGELARAGRRHVREHFDVDRTMAGYRSAWEAAMATRESAAEAARSSGRGDREARSAAGAGTLLEEGRSR